MKTKRIFDVILALFGLIILSPLFLVIFILVMLDSKGGALYRQVRVGKNMEDFQLHKFRTMYVHASDQNLITIGSHDARITRVGCWLRKYKLDELPQLINILKGHMSFVGPRPEVRKYVNMYNEEQQKVLSVKPGITDWASIQFYNENQLLEDSGDPESYYIHQLFPLKLIQNLRYINHSNILIDIKIILLTLKRVVSSLDK
ncbi:MAG: sugar transferase [Chryseobacterium sp.]|nr:MAG: sugar transferase [Chryseobacterium sp.]